MPAALNGAPPAKQKATHEQWVRALETVADRMPVGHIEARTEQAAERVRELARRGRVAFAWSGGKESVALEAVCQRAGVAECVLVICDLEYPEFLGWVTDYMPAGLEVVNTRRDLRWLAERPKMLFPQTAAIAAQWFHNIQHAGQRDYFRRRGLDYLLLGRRRGDGNYVGPPGQWSYRDHAGITRTSPLYDWTNDELLGLIHYSSLPLPPCYRWPRGFRVGTGPWPARQWCPTVEAGWREVYSIDRTRVEEAAPWFASARAFLAAV